jgi:hypothetical protein
MKVVPATWEDGCLLEANKFWFYALVLSLISSSISMVSIFFSSSTLTTRTTPTNIEKETEKAAEASEHQNRRTALSRSVLKQIAIDGCDLFIPGTMLGWIYASSLQVGMAMAVSTVLAAGDIWVKAQRR